MRRYTVKTTAGMFLLIGFLLIGIALDIVWAMDGGQKAGFHEPGMMSPMGPRGMGITGKGMADPEPPVWRHLLRLGLDEKQKEAIKKIESREAKDIIKKRADIRIADIELRDILDKDPVDINAVEAKLKKISLLMTDMRLSEIKAIEEIKTKLTPEQIKSFKEMLEIGHGMGGILHDGMRMPPPPPMTGYIQHP